jgi:hypothetical protein
MKKDDAVRRAQVLAQEAGAACFVFGPGGTLIERYEAKATKRIISLPEPLLEVVEPAPAPTPTPTPAPALAPEPALTLAPEPEPEPTLALAPEPEPEITLALAPAPEPALILEPEPLEPSPIL